MPTFAVAVVGRDRPGIIADVTGALAAHGGNLEDSSMSLLRGTFAWTLVVSFDVATAADLDSTLDPLRSAELAVTVFPVAATGSSPHADVSKFQLTVHGADHSGIVSAVTRVVADHGGNITDLSTRLGGALYVVIAEFDLPVGRDEGVLAAELARVATTVGVTAHLASADSDVL